MFFYSLTCFSSLNHTFTLTYTHRSVLVCLVILLSKALNVTSQSEHGKTQYVTNGSKQINIHSKPTSVVHFMQ